MRRGFKAEAKRKSTELRKQLGIQDFEALDCFRLVDYLEIPTHSVDELGKFGLTTDQIETICYSDGKQQFSATTIAVPDGHLIIYNQAHSFARTNSSIAHEVSHVICEHEFSSISDMRELSREFDKNKEDEANWMAGCLLLPEEGLIWALKRSMSMYDIADHFNISRQMTQWRYNATGMSRRIKYIR